MNQLVVFLVVVFWLSAAVESFNLTILNVNDIHVRIEETNKYSSNCKPRDQAKGQCYGGLARLHAAVTDLKEKEDHVVWLNAGDFFQGTVWYTQFKWRVVSLFNNLLDFDAMTLGNHEFDDSVAGLVPFLQNQTCPIVVTNLDTSQVPEMDGLTVPSRVLTLGGRAVGLVGYLTPETAHISNPGKKIVIRDEIEALKTEVARLKDAGVNIIIALGHSGYSRDLEVAKAVPDIDVIVGGHSHSFLYTETDSKPNPSTNTIVGPYPTLVQHSDPVQTTLVLQAYAFTKYLGHVSIQFDEEGRQEGWEGEPLLLDNSFRKDPLIEAAIVPWRQQLDEFVTKIVGTAGEVMFISRGKESRLGNFVTDAMVDTWQNKTMADGSRVRLAITNSGGIRATLDKGNITVEDLLSTFPFQNTFDVVTISGKVLKQAFEHSVAQMSAQGGNGGGRFLQVSGFRLEFDLTKKPGARLISALALCGNCDSDTYKEVTNMLSYNVVVTNYIAGGGDGYTMLKNRSNFIIGSLDTDVLTNAIEKKSPINTGVEGRISLITEKTKNGGINQAVTSSYFFLMIILYVSHSI